MIHKDYYGPIIELGKTKKNNIKKISQIPINYSVVSDFCVIGEKCFHAIQNEPNKIFTTDEKIKTKIAKLAQYGIFKDNNSKLVVLERNYDKLIHLLIPWHYESMLHFHDIKLVNEGEEDYVYDEMRCMRFDKAFEHLKSIEKEITDTEIDKNNPSAICKYILKKKLLKKHHDTMLAISCMVKYNNFLERSEEEQKIITICEKDSLKMIADVGKKMKDLFSKLALIPIPISIPKTEVKPQSETNGIDPQSETKKINPEVMTIAANMKIGDKNTQNPLNPMFMQYLPKIRKIMDNHDGEENGVIYIYIKDFICYEEIIEIEKFNEFSSKNGGTKFILLSDTCKNHWNYHYTSEKDFNMEINHFDIYNDADRKLSEELYPEIKKNLDMLNNMFRNTSGFDSVAVKNMINKLHVEIANAYKKLDSFVIENENSATGSILKNKKSRCRMELSNFALELQKSVKKQKRHDDKMLEKEKKEKEEKEDLLDKTSREQTQEQISQEQIAQQTDYIKQREKDIKELHENIMLMNKIFVDLNVIIESQDVILNDVNQNILSSKDSIIKGNSEIKKTVEIVKKNNDFNVVMAITGVVASFGAFVKIAK